MQHRTATETESSKTVRLGKESIVSFTSVQDDEGIGGSKTATNVQSSGDTDVNQHETIEKDQLRDNSLCSAKGAFNKSYHDAEREAMIQMSQNERQEDVKKRMQLDKRKLQLQVEQAQRKHEEEMRRLEEEELHLLEAELGAVELNSTGQKGPDFKPNVDDID